MNAPELQLYNPVTIPPAGAPCEWCGKPGATELCAITEPKVVRSGEHRGEVKAHGTAVRVCSDCGARLDARLEEKRQAEAAERERKLAERRKLKETRRR